ncbi:MAG TPA: YoaK family protein [Steroidobacteraceae bacterium]|nr:YoaK family protein [Steroidobacteraceae bacterium]
MDRGNRSQLALAIILIAVAGWVDAVGLLRLGHLFVSFMSGNSTQLAVSGLGGRWRRAGAAGGIVGLFVAGVIGGRLLSNCARAWGRPAVLLAEAVLLTLGAAVGRSTRLLIVPIVLAMGIQNAAIDKERAADMGLSYVTGTLVSLGDGLADAIHPPVHGRREEWVPHLLHWLALVLGALGGAASFHAWGRAALGFPAGVALVLASVSAARIERGRAQ